MEMGDGNQVADSGFINILQQAIVAFNVFYKLMGHLIFINVRRKTELVSEL